MVIWDYCFTMIDWFGLTCLKLLATWLDFVLGVLLCLHGMCWFCSGLLDFDLIIIDWLDFNCWLSLWPCGLLWFTWSWSVCFSVICCCLLVVQIVVFCNFVLLVSLWFVLVLCSFACFGFDGLVCCGLGFAYEFCCTVSVCFILVVSCGFCVWC